MGKKLKFDLKLIIWFLPAALVTLGIFLLSTILSFPMQVEGVSYLDKIQHSFAYFVLILSFLIAYKQTSLLEASRVYKTVILASLYGFSLEIVQYTFFSYRYFEWIDALANVLGVAIGYFSFKLFVRAKD